MITCVATAPARGRHLGVAVAAVLMVAALARPAAAETPSGWTNDYEAAKAEAARDGKQLLLFFTGSDWCGWCKKLRREVFDTNRFMDQAGRNYVLVELDFPMNEVLPDRVRRQNEQLARRFGVQGYPTVYIADASGRPYARLGYRPGGPAAFLRALDVLRARHEGAAN